MSYESRRGQIYLWLIGILSKLSTEDSFNLDEEMRKAYLGEKNGGKCSDKKTITDFIDIMHRSFTDFKREVFDSTDKIREINAKGDAATQEELVEKQLCMQRLFALDKIGVGYEDIWFSLDIVQQFDIILKKCTDRNIFPRVKYLNTNSYITPDYDDNLMWQRKKVMANEKRLNNSRDKNYESYTKLPLFSSRAELRAGLDILKTSDENCRLQMQANQLLREQIILKLNAASAPKRITLLAKDEQPKDEGKPKDEQPNDEQPNDEGKPKDEQPKDEGKPKDEQPKDEGKPKK